MNFLCFLQEIRVFFTEKIREKHEIFDEKSVFNVLKALYFWGVLTNSRISINGSLLSLFLRISLMISSKNYEETMFFLKISPKSSLESDVFWVFLMILTTFTKKFFLLEAPLDPLRNSNHYCYSDLRGVKKELFLLKLYIKANFLDIYSLFQQNSIESFIFSQILELSSQICDKRSDIFARFLDRVLVGESLAEKPVFLGLLSSIFRRLSEKNAKNMKNTKDFRILWDLELKTLENIEEFLDSSFVESERIHDFHKENSAKITLFEKEILGNFEYFNEINRLIYGFIEEICVFSQGNSKNSIRKVALCDLSRILHVEDLLKEGISEENSFVFYVFIHEIVVFYPDSFEGEVFLEVFYGEVREEIALKLIVETRIELNEYLCFKGRRKNVKIALFLKEKLIKKCEISLEELETGVLRKIQRKLISEEKDFNFLASEITVSVLFMKENEKNSDFSRKSQGKTEKNSDFSTKYQGKTEKNREFSQNFCNFEEFSEISLESFQEILKRNLAILHSKNADFTKEIFSASCSKNVFFSLELSLDEACFLEISKFLGSEAKNSILYENWLKIKGIPMNFAEFSIGFLVNLSGSYKEKTELFYRLLVILNKGSEEISLLLFKSSILLIYRFLGLFIKDFQLENLIDSLYYSENKEILQEFGLEKAEIREKNEKNIDISFVLKDFLIKKQIVTQSKDLILGAFADLFGLKDILLFYYDFLPEETKKQLAFIKTKEKNEKNRVFEIEIKFTNNQGLKQTFLSIFDENFRILPSFYSAFSKKPCKIHKIHEEFFYNHRNVLVLNSFFGDFLTKDRIFFILQRLPGFDYMLSLQSLHKIFERKAEDPLSNFSHVFWNIRCEKGLKINAKISLDLSAFFLSKIRKKNKGLLRIKARKLALELEILKEKPQEKEEKHDEIQEISLKNVCFYDNLEELLLKILVKTMKKLKEIHYYKESFIDKISQISLEENPSINPIDSCYFSLFSLFSLNKRQRKMSFSLNFLQKTSKKQAFSLKDTQAIALYHFSDQRSLWLPIDLLHSFLPKNSMNSNEKNTFFYENKHNYDYFTVKFLRFPEEILIKKPFEIIFFRKADLRNRLFSEKTRFFSRINEKNDWKRDLENKEEKTKKESIFKEIVKDNYVFERKFTVDDRKKVERKPGKRVLSYRANEKEGI